MIEKIQTNVNGLNSSGKRQIVRFITVQAVHSEEAPLKQKGIERQSKSMGAKSGKCKSKFGQNRLQSEESLSQR